MPTDCQMDVSGRELDVSEVVFVGAVGLVIKAGGHHIHMVIKATILLKSMWEEHAGEEKRSTNYPHSRTHHTQE